MIKTSDSLEFLKTMKDFEFDINFCDPPYALGSEVVIRPDGKVDYSKATDILNKWEMPTGEYWEKWFVEAFRTLKHGGYLLMYGMDRQLLLFKYYAKLAGFEEYQSLYWYFISNFPKASDLGKMLDKNAGVEVKEYGRFDIGVLKNDGSDYRDSGSVEYGKHTPQSDLGVKYQGFKYSVATLKQTCETVMVFHKPYKTGSCMYDTIEYENGDKTCLCGAYDIGGNRVGNEKRINRGGINNDTGAMTFLKINPDYEGGEVEGRYPSQTFVDEGTADILDRQSGVSSAGRAIFNSEITRQGMREDAPTFNSKNTGFDVNKGQGLATYGDSGGCSKILNTCRYMEGEHDLFIYEPKVNDSERNGGVSGEKRVSGSYQFQEDGSLGGRPQTKHENHHPTLKPIELNEKIMRLFKTPNPQKVVYPFAGAGSEVIGGIRAGFEDWIGCEINQEYVDIANQRLEYWGQLGVQISLFD